MRSFLVHPNHYKFFFTFFLSSIRMSGKNVNSGDKKITKKQFLQKQKSNKDSMLMRYWFLKKNHMVRKILSNTLLDTMKMMLSYHYA